MELNLTKENRLRHPPKETLKRSVYPLSQKSRIQGYPGAICSTTEDFEAMWQHQPEPTRNPYGGFVHRRQGTYGGPYHFAGQVSEDLGSVSTAPALVQKTVEWAQAYAVTYGIDPALAKVAHCNWYTVTPDAVAALQQHQDLCPPGRSESPIVSATFLQDGEAPYRYFLITADREGKHRVGAFPLQNGDVIVMEGATQSEFYHGVPSVKRKDHIGQRRINITVRFWG